jgi:hypothetical protein
LRSISFKRRDPISNCSEKQKPRHEGAGFSQLNQNNRVIFIDPLRLPPHLLLKLDRGAAHLQMSRNAYIAAILKRALEGGRPMIFTADATERSVQRQDCGGERSS